MCEWHECKNLIYIKKTYEVYYQQKSNVQFLFKFIPWWNNTHIYETLSKFHITCLWNKVHIKKLKKRKSCYNTILTLWCYTIDSISSHK